jgi:hypothetical protein
MRFQLAPPGLHTARTLCGMPPKIYLKLLNKILLTQETKLDILEHVRGRK